MRKYLIPGLILWILAIGLWAGLILTQQKQEIRKPAVVLGGVGKITLSPQTTNKYPGERFSTVINFQTGTTPANAVAISSISLRITYPYSGITPELDVVDSEGNPSDQIYPDINLLLSEDWSFPIKSVTRSGGMVTIDLAAINTSISGYTSSTPTPLATIYFKANRIPISNPIILSFDLNESKMLTKGDPPQDILDVPGIGQYTIQEDTQTPAAVNNLAITGATKTSLDLSWSAPSDIGPEGKAYSYDLRYSTSTITESNWPTATKVTGLPTPVDPGTLQTFTLSSLGAGTTYYLALKSTDASGNTSDLSNVASGATSPATLSFGFRLQGVSTGGLVNPLEVTLKGPSTKVYPNISFTSDSSGVFTPSAPLSLTDFSIPSSGVSIEVLVKDNSHLRKNLGAITLLPTDNVGPSSWHSISLKAGDFNNDNVLNIIDIGNLLSVYTTLSVPVTSVNQIYDVDCNDIININDIALVLANYTALEVRGDN